MLSFVIEGCHSLRGEVKISGSKNAALPILAATLLTDEPCVIRNVPEIDDIRVMIELLRVLGKGVELANNTVTVWKGWPVLKPLPQKLVCKMRASVLLLGPLLARFGRVSMSLPGGCVLGKRSFDTHLRAFETFGVENHSTDEEIKLKAPSSTKGARVMLQEFSVTATENILLFASLISSPTEIHLAAIEPHVQDLCHFLQKLGVSITGIGTHTLRVTGNKKLRGAIHAVTPDYLEAGTLAIATALTSGDVTLRDTEPQHLLTLWNFLERLGVKIEISKQNVRVYRNSDLAACGRLQTAIYPGFPTDLQAPFAVLLTQAKGETAIHETLFEGRLHYLRELQKMGADAEIKNEHEAIVRGPSKLHGTQIFSCDIRAGAGMILAGLVASGKTEVMDVQYLDRGYERFDEKLQSLGARIERIGGTATFRKKTRSFLEHQFDIPILPLR